MKKQIGIVMLCVSLSCTALALDKPDAEKKAKPVPHPLSHSWDRPGPTRSELQAGTPEAAGMSGARLDEIDALIETAIDQKLIPGAVVLIARRGVIVKEQAYGFSAKYTDDKYTLMDHPIPMQTDTMFDLASISKLFTSTAVMQLCEQGLIGLDAPVASYLPEFAAGGRKQVTIRQLLTHTSGFPAYIPLYKEGKSRAERMQIVLRQPLVNEPGSTYVYSDVNMMVLGALVERISGKRLDAYIQANITRPLRMSRTMFNPPKHLQKQIASTEYQSAPERGLVWGEVQDENAWSLGGVAGHAGLFGTARDLAVFAQMMLNGGTYGGKRILSAQSVALLTKNQLPTLPGEAHGLGWELDRGSYMDALGDSRAMGHTGFTGTSLVVSPNQETIGILLTNRIHPVRDTHSLTPIRSRVMRQVALAIPVDIPWREGAWFAGVGDDRQAVLTAEADLGTGGTLTYDTWFRLENEYDFGYVEVSRNGTDWEQIGQAATGESDWTRVSQRLPAGTRYIRFRYATDGTINGRGWYVHHPAVFDRSGREVRVVWKAEDWQQNAQIQAQIPDLIIHLNIPGVDEQPAGDTLQLQALHVYRDGQIEKVTRRLQWKSSNKGVATVDQEGIVHFASDQGTVFISVSDGRVEDRIELVYRKQGRPRVTVIKQKGERYQLIGKLIAGMTLEEKVGQMLMPDFRRVGGKNVTTLLPEIAEMIRKYHIGGVILFRENAADTVQTVRLVHEYQQAAPRFGLLVAIDQEGGVVSRLQQGTDLPGNMALGAARSRVLAWKAGDIIGSELASLGINTNFAPDMDVNNNPDNPVIGVRSFGEDPQLVADLGVAYMKGLQHNGIVATIKHFPGHGDTSVDSHLGLPQVPHDLQRLSAIELYPFRQAIAAGADAIMTAHVTFPKLDETTVISKKDGSKIALPATLSPKVITGLIREGLAFDGVIFTDAMNMQAISDHFGQDEAAVRAIQAGADVLLMPTDLEKVTAGIVGAVKKGQIAEERIDQSLGRILSLKIKRGMMKEEDPESMEAKQIQAQEVMGSSQHKQVESEAALRSVTLVKNNGVLPLKLSEAQRIAVVGDEYVENLAEALKKHHAQTTAVRASSRGLIADQWKQVMQVDAVILASCTADVQGRSVDNPLMKLFRQIIERTEKPVIGVAIRNPYDIMAYPQVDAYLAQYGYRAASFAATAETIFGWNHPTGRLPVTIPDGKGGVLYPYGHGLSFEP